ncbi:MAG TPA: NADH-quinone oxidoreductase subunit NuoK [Deltaproteobacteria bacterium]|nr:MAG: NADH-quinone oxidoreductase subunit K [bacterium]HDH10304.1 NADH-quinone oxidoreductase subunit NuoK [Deltaproteobacteria bacterium]
MISSTYYIILLLILLAIGAMGVIIRKNFIIILMSLEIMLNAASGLFVVGSGITGNISGQMFFLFVAAVAAAETAVGLAIAIVIYRRKGSVDTDKFRSLKR